MPFIAFDFDQIQITVCIYTSYMQFINFWIMYYHQESPVWESAREGATVWSIKYGKLFGDIEIIYKWTK